MGKRQDQGASGKPDRAVVNGAGQAVSALRASVPSADDPAYTPPLPPTWALDAAARNNGYRDWFGVPTFFRSPENRRILVEARRIVAVYGSNELAAECRERATYLKAMEPEGLSAIMRQCMETLFKAAQAIETAKPTRREAGSARKGESAVGNADAPKAYPIDSQDQNP